MNIKSQLYKVLGKNYTLIAKEYNQCKTYLYSVIHPYHYDAERYKDTFLANYTYTTEENIKGEKVSRVIYVFWTGNNEITSNRLKGIDSLINVSGIPVKLITPENLNQYILKDYPLHPAYQYLSLVHKADYLRCYFMHHYGGGYADIKFHTHNWNHAFNKLNESDGMAIGYPEVGFLGAAFQDMEEGFLKNDLYFHWRYLIGLGSFICRPRTPFTEEWYNELHRRLDIKLEELSEHPAKDPFGKNPDYPIRWSEILGAIFHPLCLKYKDSLLKDKTLMPSFENYR